MTSAASAMPASVVTLPAGTQLSSAQKPAATSAATLDESDFLQLLTTQLEKQNPLNPQSPSDFAAELAQFSTASGMQSLNAAITGASSLQSASLVGHRVAVPGNTLQLDASGGAQGGLQLSAAASDVVVRISDAKGSVVATLDLGPMAAGNQNFVWNGQGADGKTVAPGAYSFSVAATGAPGAAVAATAYAVVPVTAVSLGGQSGPVLELGGGLAAAPLSAVQQIF